MSRTWKIHTHHAGRDNWKLVKEKNKKHSIRRDIKVSLKNFDEDTDTDLTQPVSAKKSSSVSNWKMPIEDAITNFYSDRSMLLNGVTPWWIYGCVFDTLSKKLISRMCEVKGIVLPSYNGTDEAEHRKVLDKEYELEHQLLIEAIRDLPEEEVINMIKAEYAAKGIR